VGFRVAGDYFESCTCDVSCNCIFLGLATQDHCDVVIGWHITDGRQDEIDLRGLNAAMVIRSPKRMLDGNWQVALYLDDRASESQAQALGAIFSGQAGGHLAALGPLIGQVAGVTSAPISFENLDGKRRLKVGDVIEGEISELQGGDGKSAPVISNAPFGALPQPVRQGRAETVQYHGHWETNLNGTNAFLAEFAYEG
jgi:hypothetical protein